MKIVSFPGKGKFLHKNFFCFSMFAKKIAFCTAGLCLIKDFYKTNPFLNLKVPTRQYNSDKLRAIKSFLKEFFFFFFFFEFHKNSKINFSKARKCAEELFTNWKLGMFTDYNDTNMKLGLARTRIEKLSFWNIIENFQQI